MMDAESVTRDGETFTASSTSFFNPNSEVAFKAFSATETSAIPGSDTNQWATGTPSYDTGSFTGTYRCCHTQVDGSDVAGEWLQLQCSNTHVLKRFSIMADYWNPRRAPRSFVLAGSEDGLVWTALHAAQDVGEWESKQPRFFEASSDYAARYFRLVITAVYGTQSWLAIDKLWLFEDNPPQPIPFHPTMACKSAAQGDEVFVASASSFYAPNKEMPFKAFSASETSAIPGSDTNQWTTGTASYETGDFTGTYSCCSTSVNGKVVEGEWLQLQCSKPHVLKSFSITANYWNPVRAPKSFVLAGSEYGDVWTVLHAEQELGLWSSMQTRHFAVSSDYAARYFRLITTAVHGTQSWLTIDKLALFGDSA
jgi:hypothetical protein